MTAVATSMAPLPPYAQWFAIATSKAPIYIASFLQSSSSASVSELNQFMHTTTGMLY